VAEVTVAQENQAAEQGASSSDAPSDSKRERGFLKSLTQATRGHRASSSAAQQQAAGSPSEGQAKEVEGDKKGERTPSSSPSKQQKPGKSTKKSSKQRETTDDAADNNTDKTKRRGGRPKETAAPVSGHLSPIRRRPPSRSDAATIRPSAVANQLAPLSQPEMHLIGEIIGGGGFSSSGDGLICKWHVEYGSLWHHVAGHQLGQTQVAYPSPTAGFNQREDDALAVVWTHPIDVHLAMSAFQGWPKLVLQVWRVDKHMSTRVAGYGFAAVPFAPGEHELRVRLWRPVAGSWVSELGARLTGNTPELVTDDVVFRSAVADRCRLETVATGSVSVRIGIMLRNLDSLREGLSG
jgi:B9 domain-containing protein 2